MKRLLACAALPALGLWVTALCTGLAQAQIRTDGTAGSATTLSGPAYSIPQSLGRVAGSNLFHSFSTFNLASGQSATFSTTSAFSNVIARVTGGTASSIDGRMRLTAPSGSKPDFWFINPAGMVFGPNSSWSVPGALHVAAADYVQMGSERFMADPGSGSTFSTAAPQAFGFLGQQVPLLKVQGATWRNQDHAITLAGGQLELIDADIATRQGDIRLVAVGAQAMMVPVTGPISGSPSGALTLSGTWVSTEADASHPGGRIEVFGGQILLTAESLIQTVSTDVPDGGDILLHASGGLRIEQGSTILTETYDQGAAGAIRVFAPTLQIDGSGFASGDTGIVSQAHLDSTGAAGAVSVQIDGEVSIAHGGQIASYAFGAGAAGRVVVQAGAMWLDGQDAEPGYTGVFAQTDGGSGAAGGVTVEVAGDLTLRRGAEISSSALNGGQGAAGTVDVRVGGHLQILAGAEITSDTWGSGPAGIVNVQAARLTLDSQGVTHLPTDISSDAVAGSGAAGLVQVQVSGELQILGGAAISSTTHTDAPAGAVSVQAGRLLIDARGEMDSPAGIFSETLGGAGAAGAVWVQVDGLLELRQGGQISSTTFDAGVAGSVGVEAGQLLLRDPGSQIAARADADASGQTGQVWVAAQRLDILDGASLTIANASRVSDPSVLQPTRLQLWVGELRLVDSPEGISARASGNVAAGSLSLQVGGRASLLRSRILTLAQDGDGGALQISADTMDLQQSQLLTSVLGTSGNGGNIALDARVLLLRNGFIQANTAAELARGGDVQLQVMHLLPSGAHWRLGGQTEAIDSQRWYDNVVQAASPTGVSGQIQLTTPVLDLSAALTGAPLAPPSDAPFARNPCEQRDGSALVLAGRGGLPVSPRRGWVPEAPALFDAAALASRTPSLMLAGLSCR